MSSQPAERNGVEYFFRPGAKLVDENGQPIGGGWQNWSVGFITEHVVLFTDGQEDMTIQLAE